MIREDRVSYSVSVAYDLDEESEIASVVDLELIHAGP